MIAWEAGSQQFWESRSSTIYKTVEYQQFDKWQVLSTCFGRIMLELNG